MVSRARNFYLDLPYNIIIIIGSLIFLFSSKLIDHRVDPSLETFFWGFLIASTEGYFCNLWLNMQFSTDKP